MILYQADNPMDGSVYQFTRRQIKLTAQQTRRSGLQAIHRAHGALDGYGGQANPLNPTSLTYAFRFFPREDRTNYDTLRQQLAFAVGHGLPQNLRFRDDNGNIWYATGKLTSFPADVSVVSPIWQDVQVQWELPNPFLRLSRQQGEVVWGGQNADLSPILWGQTGLIWGQSPNVWTILTASYDLSPVVANPLGTQMTTDPIITFAIPASPATYGPATPSPVSTKGGGNCIIVQNLDVLVNGQPMQFNIYGTSLVPNDTLSINFGILDATLNGTHIWSRLWRPDAQRDWFALRPGNNRIRVIVTGTLAAGYTQAIFSLGWYPKTLL